MHLIKCHCRVCLVTDPLPLPKWVLHAVQSSVSFFNFQYPLISLRSSNGCFHLLPCLPVTSILFSTFPSITCFNRYFQRNTWPIQLAFILFIFCRIFLSSLMLCNTFSFLTQSVPLIFSSLLQHHISKLPRYFLPTFWRVHVWAPYISYAIKCTYNKLW